MLIHMLSQRLPPENRTGAPLQALALATALSASGDRVVVYSTLSRRIADIPPVAPGPELRLLRYRSLPFATAVMRLAVAARHAAEIGAADVVHGHALSPMVLGYALARRTGSAPFLVKPSLGGAHAEGELDRLAAVMPRRMLQHLLSRIDGFAVLDDCIEAELGSFGVGAERIHRVANGVDTTRFAPASPAVRKSLRVRHGIDGSRTVIAFVGQLSARKGVPELLEAWRSLPRGDAAPLLVLAGTGPLRETVEAASTVSGGGIRYLGELADVVPVLQMADILVLPSRAESFGNVVLEAMATAVPVAATRVGIAPAVVEENETGWVIPEVSVAGIRDTLRRALGGAAHRAAMGEAARARALEFGFATIAARYREIYAHLQRH
jgi:glycosyltransferase involved in cell wall biosynthesis